MRIRSLLIRFHIPALLAALIIVIGGISLTWEKYTSYDDGGLGSIALLVVIPIAWLSQVLSIHPLLIFVTVLAALIYTDYWLQRRAKRNE